MWMQRIKETYMPMLRSLKINSANGFKTTIAYSNHQRLKMYVVYLQHLWACSYRPSRSRDFRANILSVLGKPLHRILSMNEIRSANEVRYIDVIQRKYSGAVCRPMTPFVAVRISSRQRAKRSAYGRSEVQRSVHWIRWASATRSLDRPRLSNAADLLTVREQGEPN